MSEQAPENDSSPSPQQRTAQLLTMLRGGVKPAEMMQEHAMTPRIAARRTTRQVVSERKSAADQSAQTQMIKHDVKHDRHLRTVADRLQNSKGQLARLLAHADRLTQLNRIIQTYLPPHFQGHIRLAVLESDGWIIHADSAAWTTRLRYALPNLQRQLTDHLKAEVPRLKVRTKPIIEHTQRKRQPRRMTVTGESASVLEGAARSLGDTRLSSAMMRLAEHARQRVA